MNPPPPSTPRGIHLSRSTLAVCGLLLVIPWAVLVVVTRHAAVPPPAASAPLAAPVSLYDEFILKSRPGPWGQLEYSRILLEPPDDFTASDYVAPDHITWCFKGYTRDTLAGLWKRAGLSDSEITVLSSPAAMQDSADAIVILPPAQLVHDLSSHARTTIYSALSAFPENPNQFEPFRFRTDTADEWFDNSGVPRETADEVKRLMYRRGTSLLFSDQDLILPTLATRAERVKLIKTLARKSSLLVKLRVTPDSDIAELVEYWSRGARRKALYPFLESVSHRPRGITVDIAHLLPRFARARIYTYPQASDHPGDTNHDCHWSSLNFFNDPPDERFADADFVKQTLEKEYYAPTDGQLLLGDILLLERVDGAVIHSCIYIADDIVFTKNGSAAFMPWILMSLKDVVAFYPADADLTVHAYRKKNL